MKCMRKLSPLSCLIESYGYNFNHLRFSALCCGCQGAFGNRQIKGTCSLSPVVFSHSVWVSSAVLRAERRVGGFSFTGHSYSRRSVVNLVTPLLLQQEPESILYKCWSQNIAVTCRHCISESAEAIWMSHRITENVSGCKKSHGAH